MVVLMIDLRRGSRGERGDCASASRGGVPRATHSLTCKMTAGLSTMRHKVHLGLSNACILDNKNLNSVFGRVPLVLN